MYFSRLPFAVNVMFNIYTMSPKCQSAENTRMDSSRPWKFLCKQGGLQKNKQLNLH